MDGKTRNMKAYLSGLMDPDHIDLCIEWRRRVTDELAKYGVECISPRSIRLLSGHFDTPEGTPAEVVESDLNDIDNADMLIINFLKIAGCNKVSLGTPMELIVAKKIRGIPIITIATGYEAGHPWVQYYSTCIVSTVEEAIQRVKEYWMPGGGYIRPKS